MEQQFASLILDQLRKESIIHAENFPIFIFIEKTVKGMFFSWGSKPVSWENIEEFGVLINNKIEVGATLFLSSENQGMLELYTYDKDWPELVEEIQCEYKGELISIQAKPV